MVTTEDIKAILRGFTPHDISPSNDGTFRCRIAGSTVSVSAAQFEEYLAAKALSPQGSGTDFAIPGYYEHAIEIQGRGAAGYRLFRERDEVIMKHEQTGFIAEVSPVSSNFIMWLSDTDSLDRDFRRLVLFRRTPHRDREGATLNDLFSRVLSVKITAPNGHALYSNTKHLKAIAEASLFNISCTYGTGLILLKSWERSRHFLDNTKQGPVQFPLRTYNSELVAYYQMAVGGDSLILSYLALYKIIEYFFTGASEHLLHAKIKEQLVAPDFSHTKAAKLRDLAKVIRKFDQRMNERQMMQTVLEQHLDKDSLRTWLEDFDKARSAYFTTEREIFGERSKIDISDDKLFPTIGARVYHIRNVLVHNKEGEVSRFVPFSGQEKILVNELPLLQHIAEELILRTGKDIQL